MLILCYPIRIYLSPSLHKIIAVGVYLFFGDKLLSDTMLHFAAPKVAVTKDELDIGYAAAPASLNPTLFDGVTRSYLSDIYEGLVRTDRNLKIESGLALSWGLVDSLTWQFQLRPEVAFHNGKMLTPEDVVASINVARTSDNSQLKDLLNSIESVVADGTDKILIHTNVPDPLLLNKLSVVYIFPKGYSEFDAPVGTGPYEFDQQTNNTFQLLRFDKYWGDKPVYKKVVLKAIADRDDRVNALKDSTVQVLDSLPPALGCSFAENRNSPYKCVDLNDKDIVIKTVPSLEVSFLVFNFENKYFQDLNFRKAFAKVFDSNIFVNMAFGFARPVGQFVSSGIFGFNPEITAQTYSLDDAKTVMDKILNESFDRQEITFDYPEVLPTLGKYVQDQFTGIGLNVILNPLNDSDLQKKVLSGSSGLYFLGWRSELGDSSDFLQAVAHSQKVDGGYGQFNGSHYSNPQVDQLIEDSQKNLDSTSRLQQLQNAMKIIVSDDVIGVPLFESDHIYAYRNKINFEPRLDGYIHASEIK